MVWVKGAGPTVCWVAAAKKCGTALQPFNIQLLPATSALLPGLPAPPPHLRLAQRLGLLGLLRLQHQALVQRR